MTGCLSGWGLDSQKFFAELFYKKATSYLDFYNA
jgi:hypothetical protein